MDHLWLIVDNVKFPLPQGETIIGRGDDCDLVLAGRGVSKKHLSLQRTGSTVTFRDLQSSKGTELNGEACNAGTLKLGDVLTIADVDLHFLERKKPKEEELHQQPFDWKPFEAFFARLRSTTDPSALLEQLLHGLVDILAADRGFILLAKEAGERLVPVVSHSIENAEEFVAISSTIYKRALKAKKVVFIANSMTDAWYLAESKNTLGGESRSIICGPLAAAGRTYGVIYVDGRATLDERHMALFEVVTGLASELLAAASIRRKLLSARGHIAALSKMPYGEDTLILGEGAAGRELRKQLEVVASQDVSVLITGETGTGKEMIARTLHRMSHRRAAAFVPVNCAALPLEVIEAELFGAEKGAFTGSTEKRVGRFELADGGTLFLDEVGELELDLQVKLLRVLQEKTISRLGGARTIPLDFRLICATNHKLEEAVKDGTFRNDLYYRINVFRMHLKPLREQQETIMALADHFLQLFGKKFGRPYKGFSAEAEHMLSNYAWPGNIRELRNAIERATLIESEDYIEPSSLPIVPSQLEQIELPKKSDEKEDPWSTMPIDYRSAKRFFERVFFQRALDSNENNITNVAKDTGLTRKTIYNKLEQLAMVPREE